MLAVNTQVGTAEAGGSYFSWKTMEAKQQVGILWPPLNLGVKFEVAVGFLESAGLGPNFLNEFLWPNSIPAASVLGGFSWRAGITRWDYVMVVAAFPPKKKAATWHLPWANGTASVFWWRLPGAWEGNRALSCGFTLAVFEVDAELFFGGIVFFIFFDEMCRMVETLILDASTRFINVGGINPSQSI